MIDTLIILLILIGLYLLPSILANNYNRKNTKAIIILNFFLGCTFIGWVIALIWSMIED